MSPTKHLWSRLREAREGRLMSLDDLAEKVGTTRQAIYYYEMGKRQPRPEMAALICNALSVAPEFFMLPEPEPEPSPAFFRQFKSKVRAKHRAAVEVLRVWVRDSVAAVEDRVVLPEQQIPNFFPPSDPRELSNEQIEQSAKALRDYWGFGGGAIREIVKLVESKGCIVIANLFDDPSEVMDGFSWWSHKGRPFIVIGCRDVKGPHRIMDVAHELGHLILHRNVDKRFLELNTDTHRLIETQAFRFAGAFLMPADTFRRSVPTVTLDTLLMAKSQWFLSVQAMLQRARDLEMIDSESFVRQRKLLIYRGWLKNEPGDDAVPLEEPRLLGNALVTLKKSEPDSMVTLRQCVGFYAPEFERYAGLNDRDLATESVRAFQPYARDGTALRLL